MLSHWIELLRKSLLFTMCFLILFFDEHLENISIIYYVLSHWIVFLDKRIVIEKPSIILYVLSHHVLWQTHCHWENLYYLVSAFSVINVQDLTLTLIVINVKSFLETLRKSLLFSKCFLIIFLDECIRKTSII